MAIDAFLDFTAKAGNSKYPFNGESQDKAFKNTFHVKSFTFAVAQKGTASTGSGLGAGKAEFEDFEFTIDTQLGSSYLLTHCAKGSHFDFVVLHVRKAGGTQQEFLRYVFGACIISSFSTSGEEESTDTVKLNYRSVYTKYLTQNDQGEVGKGPESHGGWDLKANSEWLEGSNKVNDMNQGAK